MRSVEGPQSQWRASKHSPSESVRDGHALDLSHGPELGLAETRERVTRQWQLRELAGRNFHASWLRALLSDALLQHFDFRLFSFCGGELGFRLEVGLSVAATLAPFAMMFATCAASMRVAARLLARIHGELVHESAPPDCAQ